MKVSYNHLRGLTISKKMIIYRIKGTVVDQIGFDYVVDVGEDETNFDTIIVKLEEIEGKL